MVEGECPLEERFALDLGKGTWICRRSRSGMKDEDALSGIAPLRASAGVSLQQGQDPNYSMNNNLACPGIPHAIAACPTRAARCQLGCGLWLAAVSDCGGERDCQWDYSPSTTAAGALSPFHAAQEVLQTLAPWSPRSARMHNVKSMGVSE